MVAASISAIAGMSIEGLILYAAVKLKTDGPWLLQVFGWPGFVISIPIYVAVGDVHGSYFDFWFYSTVPLNGVAYWLIAYYSLRFVQRRRAND